MFFFFCKPQLPSLILNPTRGRFHQHFTHSFFVRKCFAQLSLDTFQLCNFWHKNISAKCTCKMLMILTPAFIICKLLIFNLDWLWTRKKGKPQKTRKIHKFSHKTPIPRNTREFRDKPIPFITTGIEKNPKNFLKFWKLSKLRIWQQVTVLLG